jgi:hypothetical protein
MALATLRASSALANLERIMSTFTSKEDQEFFAAIGRLTISWAQIELGLDCAIDIIHRFLGGKQIDPEAPRTSLSRKLNYIRKWAKTSPEPTFRDAVQKLMNDIEAAAEARHDLIHGIIIEQEEGSGEAKMVRLLHRAARPPGKKYYEVTTVQILRAAVAAGKLGGRSLKMGTGLQNLLPVLSEIAKQPDGKLGG